MPLARSGIPLLPLMAAGFLAIPAAMAEEGKWVGRAILVETTTNTVKVPDQEDHLLYLLEYDGVVFNEKGGTFLDKARYQAAHIGDSGGMVDGGYKTFTMPDGSQVVAKYDTTEAAPPVYKGTWRFIAGTGVYKGIKGEGVYTFSFVSEKAGWDLLEGSYSLP